MGQSINPKTVILYRNNSGEEPFVNWLNGLKDSQARRRVLARLRRIEQGNYGDCKYLHNGVFELRLFFGAGYRVYFAEDGDNIVVLLTGGHKGSQSKDIERAVKYWQEYQTHD